MFLVKRYRDDRISTKVDGKVGVGSRCVDAFQLEKCREKMGGTLGTTNSLRGRAGGRSEKTAGDEKSYKIESRVAGFLDCPRAGCGESTVMATHSSILADDMSKL